jgi:hypothetical protein
LDIGLNTLWIYEQKPELLLIELLFTAFENIFWNFEFLINCAIYLLLRIILTAFCFSFSQVYLNWLHLLIMMKNHKKFLLLQRVSRSLTKYFEQINRHWTWLWSVAIDLFLVAFHLLSICVSFTTLFVNRWLNSCNCFHDDSNLKCCCVISIYLQRK